MKPSAGFVPGYHAPAAGDTSGQILVAPQGTTAPHAQQPLKANTGQPARAVAADAGPCSEATLRERRRRHIHGYVTTGWHYHGHAAAAGIHAPRGTRTRARQVTRRRGGSRSRSRRCKQTGTPGFGQSNQARGCRHMRVRGLDPVAQEGSLVCLAHNVLKRANARA
ncbi:MAG: hypothetical protein ABI604_12480 [Nitrospirota bacterium]